LDVDVVAAQLAAGALPAFLYVIPEGHNPVGVRLSHRKRERLAALAVSYGLPIIEDDPYGFLVYDPPPGTDPVAAEGRDCPPLRALAPEWVFYVGSFSKIMAPGLRLGWLVAPGAVQPLTGIVREGIDLETSALTQRAVARYLDAGHLPAHLARLRATYQERRDIMLTALARHFPAEARWTRPHAGMFVWVEMPRDIDTLARLPLAVAQEKVAYVPGQAFAAAGTDASHCLRLSYSNCPPDRIEDGIRRLAKVLA
jgi:2-aminoadipate transaminase